MGMLSVSAISLSPLILSSYFLSLSAQKSLLSLPQIFNQFLKNTQRTHLSSSSSLIHRKMGASNSKPEKTDALKMCKVRKKLIKQAMDSRYSLAAAHVAYIQSLRYIGVSLRRFAASEVVPHDSSLSPSHSSYPSPSPSNPDAYVSDSPVKPRLSYMRSGAGGVAVTVRYNPATNTHSFVDDETMGFPLPPPPPPPPEFGASWDYFDAVEQPESFRFDTPEVNSSESVRLWGEGEDPNPNSKPVNPLESGEVKPREGGGQFSKIETGESSNPNPSLVSAIVAVKDNVDRCGSVKEKRDSNPEREDPSEFITHRAKDFISSIKEIEHRFFRSSEAGKEVARLLEGSKIRVGYADAKGSSSSSPDFLATACSLACCHGRSVHASHDNSPQNVPKIIVWNRSTSSQSSSSRNPLTTASKDDANDSGSECVEEFCMISGSHSSTLDRLYAWERKLYDEVKASEAIRKVYDKKCARLRHQFAKDQSAHVIDKTRSAVKDLHSRIRVALHAVDSIAKRIEKMRDEELHPQLTELIQGFIRMWKAMLECHHAQYITISLAYHARTTMGGGGGTPEGDARRQIMANLLYEFECFGLSFANWMNSHTSYVEALNGWLQSCVMPTQERSRGNKRPFSPRRAVAPPIFVLCRDWTVGIRALPSIEVSDAIRSFLSDLHNLMKKEKACSDSLQEKEHDISDGKSGNLSCIHTSMTKVLDKLTKFSEASLKLYEEIKQKNEAARVAYSNPRAFRY